MGVEMAKRTKKQILEKECIVLWRQASVKRWGGHCAICGKVGDHMHHFIARSRSTALKYDVENAVPLCRGHHYSIHNEMDILKRRALEDFIINGRGLNWLTYISEHKSAKIQVRIWWLEDIKKELEGMLNG